MDPDLLTALAAACRDQRRLRVRYPGRDGLATREVEPHRLVHTPRRWYLLAWDLGRADWRTFRVDRIQGPLGPPGARFAPRPLPAADVAAYVSQSIASAPYRYQARILFRAPAADVAGRTSPAAGRLEAAGPDACILHTGSNSLDELALYVGLKGVRLPGPRPARARPRPAVPGRAPAPGRRPGPGVAVRRADLGAAVRAGAEDMVAVRAGAEDMTVPFWSPPPFDVEISVGERDAELP